MLRESYFGFVPLSPRPLLSVILLDPIFSVAESFRLPNVIPLHNGNLDGSCSAAPFGAETDPITQQWAVRVTAGHKAWAPLHS